MQKTDGNDTEEIILNATLHYLNGRQVFKLIFNEREDEVFEKAF